MPSTTITDYINAAPPEGHPLLRQLHQLLKNIAPDAEETIKWGTPFFVEPRFLFAFSAHKKHLSFTPSEETLNVFREELTDYETTKNLLKISYQDPLPTDLIRQLAEHQLRRVAEREDDSFW